MDNLAGTSDESPTIQPKWKPLSSMQRRIVGVLVEKAKTTPDAYPLSIKALTTGCNQKSNRQPQMNLNPDQIEDALDKLRYMGAISEVQGSGRVPRYRHFMKDWLGVSGDELAVMAELLLRGAQTVGELRGRSARMADIPDLSSLHPVLAALQEKGLVIALTPQGRGQVVCHSLFREHELEQLRAQYGTDRARAAATSPVEATPTPSAPSPVVGSAVGSATAQTGGSATASGASSTAAPVGAASNDEIARMRTEIAGLREEMARMRKDIDDLWENLR